MSEQPQPDAFACPFRRQCWQREVTRYAVGIVLAAVTAWATGCALQLRGPGIDLDIKPVYPTTKAAAVPAHN